MIVPTSEGHCEEEMSSHVKCLENCPAHEALNIFAIIVIITIVIVVIMVALAQDELGMYHP